MRYFLHIAYQGFNFRGWQKQPGEVRSVQGTLERCLSKVLKEDITVVGCGRTDAQVHASQFFLHFDTAARLDEAFLFVLNKTLPHSISAFDILPVDARAHARFDPKLRQYDYLIHTEKQAFLSRLSALYEFPNLDIELMREAAGLLPQYKDFRAYCLKPDKHNTTICHLQRAEFYANAACTRLRFQVTANRFLRGMIRILVHQLLELGRGRISLSEFERPLRLGQPPKPLRSTHPQGLYLSRVEYPYLDCPPRVKLAFEAG